MDARMTKLTHNEIIHAFEVGQNSGPQALLAYLGQFDVIESIRELAASGNAQGRNDSIALIALAGTCYFETARPEALESLLRQAIALPWPERDEPALHELQRIGQILRLIEVQAEAWSKTPGGLRRCLDLIDSLPRYEPPRNVRS